MPYLCQILTSSACSCELAKQKTRKIISRYFASISYNQISNLQILLAETRILKMSNLIRPDFDAALLSCQGGRGLNCEVAPFPLDNPPSPTTLLRWRHCFALQAKRRGLESKFLKFLFKFYQSKF